MSFFAFTVASVQTPKLQEGVCTEACHNNLFGIIVISFSVCVKSIKDQLLFIVWGFEDLGIKPVYNI